jgi:hypothetical protein
LARRQTPYYWASQNHSPENSEYVIYLYKRSLRNKQKHGLEEYELVSSGLAPRRNKYFSTTGKINPPSTMHAQKGEAWQRNKFKFIYDVDVVFCFVVLTADNRRH